MAQRADRRLCRVRKLEPRRMLVERRPAVGQSGGGTTADQPPRPRPDSQADKGASGAELELGRGRADSGYEACRLLAAPARSAGQAADDLHAAVGGRAVAYPGR